MAKPRHLRLSKRAVDRLPVDGGDIVFRGRELPGFRLLVHHHLGACAVGIRGCKSALIRALG